MRTGNCYRDREIEKDRERKRKREIEREREREIERERKREREREIRVEVTELKSSGKRRVSHTMVTITIISKICFKGFVHQQLILFTEP